MTADELQAIRERCENATQGPWYWSRSENAFYTLKCPVVCVTENGELRFSRDDADFITLARTDIPDLLAEVERLTNENTYHSTQLDRAREEIQRLRNILYRFVISFAVGDAGHLVANGRSWSALEDAEKELEGATT